MAPNPTTDPDAQGVVTFARPEESGAFRRRLTASRRMNWGTLPVVRGRVGERDVVVVHTGIGPDSAGRTMQSLLAAGKPRMMISAGFAGGLDPGLRVGDTLAAEFSSGVILSRPEPIETPAEKAAIFRETGARLVDMETATIAGACGRVGVWLLSVRAVSDSAAEPLPVPFGVWFDLARQRARPLALMGYLIWRPARAVAFARFVSRLPGVAASLAAAVERALR